MTERVEGRPLAERQLVTSAQKGDRDAFGELVRFHQPIALRVAYLVLRDEGEAEDAVQEAFLKAYRALDRFRPEAEFRPWLLRIVRNESLNRRRSHNRRLQLALKFSSDLAAEDAAPSPEGEVLEREQRQRLLFALYSLPDRHRAVIECRYLLEMSEEETATVLSIPRGTVKSRSARAIADLEKRLSDES